MKLSAQKIATLLIALLSLVQVAQAQSSNVMSQESNQNFNQVLTSAGYGAAFGAATSAAMLIFFPNPQQNVKYILAGTAVGFAAGGIYSVYQMNHPVDAMPQPQYNHSEHEEFGPVPPSVPTSKVEPLPKGALFNTSGSQVAFDVPRIGLSPYGIALHLAQIRY